MLPRVSIIFIGAAISLVVPAVGVARPGGHARGGASLSGTESAPSPQSSARSKHKSLAARAGRGAAVPGEHDGLYVAPFGPTPIVTPHYVYIPAPATPPQPYVDPNECEDNGTNCTDAQLCEFWGENCGSFPAGIPPPPEPPPEGTQTSF